MRGHCAVCGADSHLMQICSQRYYPACPQTPEVSQSCARDSPRTTGPNSLFKRTRTAPPALQAAFCSAADLKLTGGGKLRRAPELDSQTELPALCNLDGPLEQVPRWFRESCEDRKYLIPLAKEQPPLKLANSPAHFYYAIKIDGHCAEALLGHGATNSFVL